jgi:hypothetical protein
MDDPVSAMLRAWPHPPDDRKPLTVHIAWHDRLAVMFDQIAHNGGGNGISASSAAWAADYERRNAKELREQLP